MGEWLHILLALAVLVVPLYCAYLIVRRIERKHGRRKSGGPDRL